MKKFLFTRALAAKKKNLLTFLAIFVACSCYSPVWAGETSIIPSTGTEYASYAIPIALANSNSASTGTFTSVTQQLYLVSELETAGVKAKDIISGLTFFYKGKNNAAINNSVTRHLKIYITNSALSADSFEIHTLTNEYSISRYRYIFENPGNICVCDKEVTASPIAASTTGELNISFSTNFTWDGESNIILTIFDVTNEAFNPNFRFEIKSTEHSRFISNYWTTSNTPNASNLIGSLEGEEGYLYPTTNSAKNNQVGGHRYVTKLKFTITSLIPVPENLSAESVSTSSATLSWDAVTDATSYNVKWGKTSGALDNNAEVATNSKEITGLDDGETYYFAVQAVTSEGTSDFSDEAIFNTTAIPHEHDGISFSKWAANDALPTSGNWYLANNVSLGWENVDVTLTSNLNLCLDGKIANLGLYKIIVPEGKTLTIYDNVGGGKITSIVPGQIEVFEDNFKAVIVVKSGGTLVLKEGIIENNFIHDPTDEDDVYSSFAIYSNGTINLSGNVLINSNDADICLHASNVITVNGALSNAEKHSVYKMGGTFTSGWSTHMSGAHPSDYFTSANPSYAGVSLVDGEAKLVKALSLSDSEDNSTKLSGGNLNTPVMINLTRSFTSAQYNTICLPFALTNEQLQSVFGTGYDLEEFSSSSLEDETLNLAFNKVTALEAGKPYLIQPSQNVVNPTLDGVTITATTPTDQKSDTYISFHGTFSPTELEGGNKNLLFLGASNELFWPAATGNLNGFRAYFEVKGAAQKVAKRARIVQKDNTATGIEEVQRDDVQCTKVLRDGQLYLMYEGKMYDVRGQRVR